jgi:NTE family protein
MPPRHAPAPRSAARRKKITLALQGGGTHGAFTWGVLDRLVEEPALEIEAISGTSAGAMNAAALAAGMAKAGTAGAKRTLRAFWKGVSDAGDAVFDPSRYLGNWPAVQNLAELWSDALTQVWSPYDNPNYANPLAGVLSDVIDFERLRTSREPQVYVCATNVRTNERRIFRAAELSDNALLASACLPTLFQAVEVDGEHYWDGGYVGNPALEPLLDHCPDLLVVQVNAVRRPEIPRTAEEIVNRVNEITFDSALVQEVHAINDMNKLLLAGRLVGTRHKYIRFHVIEAGDEMAALGARSKNDTGWTFLTHLHALGRKAAGAWLADPERFGKVGRDCTVDVERHFPRHRARAA